MRRRVLIVLLLGIAGSWTVGAACGQNSSAQSVQDMSLAEFLAMMETAASEFDSVQLDFQFRGFLGARKAPFTKSQGTWWFRRDGYERIDATMTSGEDLADRQSVAATHLKTPNAQTEITDSQGSRFANIHQTDHAWRGDQADVPSSIFYLNHFSRYDDNHIYKRYGANFRVVGFDEIEGHQCLKVSLHSGFDATAPEPFNERQVSFFFWIDLNRGKRVVREEQHVESKTRQKLARAIHIELDEVDRHWVPIRARVLLHTARSAPANRDAIQGISSDPTSIGEIEIDPQSIRINSGIDTSTFQVPIGQGTRVVDHVTGKTFYEGGPPAGTPTAPPSQEELDQALSDAETQRQAIEASSRARSRAWNWPYWLLGGLSCTALVVGTIAVLRARST